MGQATFIKCSKCGHMGAQLRGRAVRGIADELELEVFPVERISDGVAQWIAKRKKTILPIPLRPKPANEIALL